MSWVAKKRFIFKWVLHVLSSHWVAIFKRTEDIILIDFKIQFAGCQLNEFKRTFRSFNSNVVQYNYYELFDLLKVTEKCNGENID